MNGLDLEWLMCLDLLSFDSVVGSLDREMMRRDRMSAILARAAYGADQKGWKDLMKALDPADQTDEDEFLMKFGGGI
jgi:hypothetical protein